VVRDFRRDLVQDPRGKWSSFRRRTGIMDRLPEWWTTSPESDTHRGELAQVIERGL